MNIRYDDFYRAFNPLIKRPTVSKEEIKAIEKEIQNCNYGQDAKQLTIVKRLISEGNSESFFGNDAPAIVKAIEEKSTQSLITACDSFLNKFKTILTVGKEIGWDYQFEINTPDYSSPKSILEVAKRVLKLICSIEINPKKNLYQKMYQTGLAYSAQQPIHNLIPTLRNACKTPTQVQVIDNLKFTESTKMDGVLSERAFIIRDDAEKFKKLIKEAGIKCSIRQVNTKGVDTDKEEYRIFISSKCIRDLKPVIHKPQPAENERKEEVEKKKKKNKHKNRNKEKGIYITEEQLAEIRRALQQQSIQALIDNVKRPIYSTSFWLEKQKTTTCHDAAEESEEYSVSKRN